MDAQTSIDRSIRPFRWDLAARSQLGNLLDGPVLETFPGFEEQLLAACARVMALCDNSELYFVGRSPESIFDYLSGLLSGTSWRESLALLHFSMRNSWYVREHPGAARGLRPYLVDLGLDPAAIGGRERTVAFVDLVNSGDTLGNLVGLLRGWSEDSRYDWNAVARRLRIVGITWQTETSPKTQRWWQQVEWTPVLRPSAIKNLSIHPQLWNYLGNMQRKVEPSFPPHRWTDERIASPDHSSPRLAALRLAVHLYDEGCRRDTRLRFARELSRQPAMRHRWFRDLIQELKR